MADKKFPDAAVEAAKALHAAGWSWARIAAVWGVDKQCVRRRCLPEFKQKVLERQARFARDTPNYARYRSLKAQARIEAAKQGVPSAVIYERWELTGFRQWEAKLERRIAA